MNSLFSSLPPGMQGELHTASVTSSQVRYANNELETVAENRHQVKTLRVIQGGRLTSTSSTRPGSNGELLRAILESAPFGTPVQYDFPPHASVPTIELVSPEVSKPSIEDLISLTLDLAQAITAYDSEIRVSAGVQRHSSSVDLSNSNGFDGHYEKTGWTVALGGQLIRDDDFLRLGEFRTSYAPDIDYEALKAEVIQLFDWARETVTFLPGSYPVIFAPAQVSHLLRPVVASLEGKAFARGISPWIDSLGEPLLDQRITLVDDGTLPRTVSSAPFDREGIPTQRNTLVDAGIARGLLLDLQTAAELERRPTGNGTASGPSPHRLLLEPGAQTLDELVRNIDCGLIVFDTMGAWTGNPYSGTVSGTISLGIKIESGKLGGRVKNCMFSVNVFDQLRESLLGLSQETRDLGGATYPFLAIDDVVITTT